MEASFIDADDTPETDPLENLDFVESLLIKGDDLQKISVIENLPKLFELNQPMTLSKIIPKLQQELPNASCEVHIVTARVFKDLFEVSVCGALVQTLLVSMDNKDPIIAGAWLETLLAVTKFLPVDVMKSQILPIITTKTQINKPLLFRIASCKMLGQIAAHPNVSPFDIKKDILPLLQSLCQDYQYEIRATMCAQIPHVAKGLQNENLVKQTVLPNLVELCSDENMTVRMAAIDVINDICPYLSNQTLISTIIPLFKQVCSKSHEDNSSTFPVVAKNFGKIMSYLYPFLASSDCLWFLQIFQSLSKRGFKKQTEVDPSWNLKSRESCALSLPPATRFVITRIPTSLEQLYSIIQDLTTDPCYVVRKAVAKTIFEVMLILDEHCRNLKGELIKLMRDEADEVLDELVPNLGRLLQCLSKANVIPKDGMNASSMDIGKALMKCQINVFNNYKWRLQVSFLRQLEFLPSVFPNDFVHQQYAPGLVSVACDSRYKPVRSQATRTLLIFLRFNVKEQQRKWIRDTLHAKLCCSKSSYTRLIYVKMCIHATEIFSNRYFKEFFIQNLLSLMDDTVSNVRLAVVNTGPLLRTILLNPPDKNMMTTLENCFTKLQSTEGDRETLIAMKCKLKEMRTVSTLKPSMLTEEKRRIDEEDKVVQGKLISIDYGALGHTIFNANINRPPASSKDSFTHQNFYVDAGIEFPLKLNDTIDSIATISLEIENLSVTTNLTDDAKVNLQKITSKLRPPGEVNRRTIKRYSSANLYESSTKTDHVVLRRRSLNISTDLSKIPISTTKMRSKENQSSNTEKSVKVSHLPVFKKRLTTDKK